MNDTSIPQFDPITGGGGPCRMCGQLAMIGHLQTEFRGGLCFPCYMQVKHEEKAAWALRDEDLLDREIDRLLDEADR